MDDRNPGADDGQPAALPTGTMIGQYRVLDLLGKRVALLVDRQHQPGTYGVRWNGKDDFGRDVASGAYLYRLQTEDYAQVRKLMLVR